MIKILLADDHQLLRQALAESINRMDDFRVTHQAANGEEVMRQVQNGARPDIAVLDINMAPIDGYATAQWLRSELPDVKVMALTMLDAESMLIRMLKCGFSGYLKKDAAPAELHKALSSMADKGSYFSYQLADKMIDIFQTSQYEENALSPDRFTARELELLQLFCSQQTYKEIAIALGLSPRTIESYRDNLFDKIGVKNRIGLVVYAIRNKLVSLG